jgi:hypothetical protein
MAHIKIIDKAIVDGKQWYTVLCSREVASWIRTLDNSTNCYFMIGGVSTSTIADINEDIYMIALIKWSN